MAIDGGMGKGKMHVSFSAISIGSMMIGGLKSRNTEIQLPARLENLNVPFQALWSLFMNWVVILSRHTLTQAIEFF